MTNKPPSHPEPARAEPEVRARQRAVAEASITALPAPLSQRRATPGASKAMILQPRPAGEELIPIVLPQSALEKMSSALGQAREAQRFLTHPYYEGYFKSGKLAQVAKAGHLSPVQHDGEKITEVVKLRNARFSPAQFVNLAFSIATFVVSQEHLARIDRQLAALNGKVDEIVAMLEDELAAPIRDIAASAHRFSGTGPVSVPLPTLQDWISDLRRVRQRVVPKVERLAKAYKPSASWTWSGMRGDIREAADRLEEGRRWIELLAICDALLHRLAMVCDAPWALDGLQQSTAELARRLDAAASITFGSTDKKCNEDKTDARWSEREKIVYAPQKRLRDLAETICEAEGLQHLQSLLADDATELCLVLEHGTVTSISQVRPSDSAD